MVLGFQILDGDGLIIDVAGTRLSMTVAEAHRCSAVRVAMAVRGDRRVLCCLVELSGAPHHILRIVTLLLELHSLLQRNPILLIDHMRFNLLSTQVVPVTSLIECVAVLRLQVPPCARAAEGGLFVSVLDRGAHLQLGHLLRSGRRRSVRGEVVTVITVLLAISSPTLQLTTEHLLA